MRGVSIAADDLGEIKTNVLTNDTFILRVFWRGIGTLELAELFNDGNTARRGPRRIIALAHRTRHHRGEQLQEPLYLDLAGLLGFRGDDAREFALDGVIGCASAGISGKVGNRLIAVAVKEVIEGLRSTHGSVDISTFYPLFFTCHAHLKDKARIWTLARAIRQG